MSTCLGILAFLLFGALIITLLYLILRYLPLWIVEPFFGMYAVCYWCIKAIAPQTNHEERKNASRLLTVILYVLFILVGLAGENVWSNSQGYLFFLLPIGFVINVIGVLVVMGKLRVE